MDSVRALMDELMGKDRDVPLNQRTKREIRYDDPTVCKYAICGLCPHGLFKNTRSDLGPCPYEMHEENLGWEVIKQDYDRQDVREHERYERRLMKLLEDLIREMDRKIAKAKERAEAESQSKPLKPDDAQRLAEMQAKAKELLKQSQEAGEAGDVDVSMTLAQKAEELKQQHDRLHRSLTAPDRTMMVCDICGVFINSTDNDQRRQEHLTGKQYLGWKAIREKYAELVAKYDYRAAARGSREPEPLDRARSASYGPGLGAPAAEDPRASRERERERSPSRREPDRREERDYNDRRASDPRDYDRDRSGRDKSDFDRRRYEQRSSDYRGGEYDRRKDYGGSGGYERGHSGSGGYDRGHSGSGGYDRGYGGSGGGGGYGGRGDSREVGPPRDYRDRPRDRDGYEDRRRY